VICTTNSIESLNSRIRRAVNARGHFLLVTWNQGGSISPRGDYGTERRACNCGVGGEVAGARPARPCGCLVAGVTDLGPAPRTKT
jgi:putative transposase